MIKIPILNIKDNEVVSHLENIYQEAQGKILELSAAPTANEPLLSADEWGVYSNVLYHRVADTILVFTPGSTISVA